MITPFSNVSEGIFPDTLAITTEVCRASVLLLVFWQVVIRKRQHGNHLATTGRQRKLPSHNMMVQFTSPDTVIVFGHVSTNSSTVTIKCKGCVGMGILPQVPGEDGLQTPALVNYLHDATVWHAQDQIQNWQILSKKYLLLGIIISLLSSILLLQLLQEKACQKWHPLGFGISQKQLNVMWANTEAIYSKNIK